MHSSHLQLRGFTILIKERAADDNDVGTISQLDQSTSLRKYIYLGIPPRWSIFLCDNTANVIKLMDADAFRNV